MHVSSVSIKSSDYYFLQFPINRVTQRKENNKSFQKKKKLISLNFQNNESE